MEKAEFDKNGEIFLAVAPFWNTLGMLMVISAPCSGEHWDTVGLMPRTVLQGTASPDEITGLQRSARGLTRLWGGFGSQCPWNENAESFHPVGNDD